MDRPFVIQPSAFSLPPIPPHSIAEQRTFTDGRILVRGTKAERKKRPAGLCHPNTKSTSPRRARWPFRELAFAPGKPDRVMSAHSPAPTGRTKIAPGKEPSDAARGREPHKPSSPERAYESSKLPSGWSLASVVAELKSAVTTEPPARYVPPTVYPPKTLHHSISYRTQREAYRRKETICLDGRQTWRTNRRFKKFKIFSGSLNL